MRLDLILGFCAFLGMGFGIPSAISGIYRGGRALWCPTHLHASFWPRRRYRSCAPFMERWRAVRRFVIRQHVLLAVQVYCFLVLFPADRPSYIVAGVAATSGALAIADTYRFARIPDGLFDYRRYLEVP